MFRFFSRRNGDSDLEEYRKGYPGKRDNNNPNQIKNLLFYQNKHPMMPDQIFIDTFHENCFGRYSALESGHTFIQWLFPIQEESPFNMAAQQLQKHEIEEMKKDPQVLGRIFKSLELMLDFYGFDIIAEPPFAGKNNNNNNNKLKKQSNTAAAKAVQENDNDDAAEKEDDDNNNKEEEEPGPNDEETLEQSSEDENDDDGEQDPYKKFDWANLKHSRCIVQRQPESKRWKQKFHNLLTHGHNNLRITRILKCIGEMGLENLKLAVLTGFKYEIFETGALENLADSYLSYWSGTIYNDSIREQFQTVPKATGKKKR